MSAYAISSGRKCFVFLKIMNKKNETLCGIGTAEGSFMKKLLNCEKYLNFIRNLLIFQSASLYNTLCERI